MNVLKILDKLSTYPLSSEELQMLANVIKLIQARWPRDLGRNFNISLQHKLLLAEPIWVEYASQPIEDNGIDDEIDDELSSLRHIAQGPLDAPVVEKYLQLLRDNHPYFPIASTQTLDLNNVVGLMQSQNERPIILPFRSGEHWLFAALYPDTIHWYDSEPDATNPTEIAIDRNLRSSTGPKHSQPQDSALFMLLGIRLIANAHAHLSQQEAEMVIPTFRSRMLVEILTRTLRPSREKFNQLLRWEKERQATRARQGYEQSGHFYDATNGMSLSPSERATPVTQGSPRSPTVSPCQFPLHAIADPPSMPDDCKTILMTLCNAVASVRSIIASESTDLAVLWSSLHDGARVSEFHRRYIGILFYEKVELYTGIDAPSPQSLLNIDQSDQSFQDVLARCRLWRDLCNLYDEPGPAKYTLLCVIPEDQLIDPKKISAIGVRLAKQNDQLKSWLIRATDLCEAIVNSRLPHYQLLIESYKYKARQPLTPEMYVAFLSLEDRPKVPIRRLLPS